MNKMEKIIALCKRRGFVFASSQIYNGFSAIYDYGPYGVELANNIKKVWWKNMVQQRQDIVGLDSSIFMHARVWQASGHMQGFCDPLIECKKCHQRLRADHLLEDIGVEADEKMSIKQINQALEKNKDKIICPYCKSKNFTKAKKFNLLVKSNLGNFTQDWDKDPAYLRGETCQGIYINFKNVVNSTRMQIPFGIAQIGKAFRNEITARRFIYRTREFEQMEMQYFTSPKNELKQYEKLKKARWQFYIQDLGINKKNLRWNKHKNLVFYAKTAYDIEYKFPFGFKEIEGVHARGDYDLSQHSKFSNQDLTYQDPQTNKKYIPHIIEASCGVGRLMLASLCQAYCEEKVNNKKRTVLRLPTHLAPIKTAIFPLLRNKPKLVKLAKQVYNDLKNDFMCEFDDHGNIGKRYRRQDEIGTPLCITIDFDSLKDNTATLRQRDSMKQTRVKIDQLKSIIKNNMRP